MGEASFRAKRGIIFLAPPWAIFAPPPWPQKCCYSILSLIHVPYVAIVVPIQGLYITMHHSV